MKKFITFVSVCISCFAVYGATSPVVQVVSYDEPLGLYYLLVGWGSGSIVDSAGHIITNNHVVDDGLGGISDDFSICITEDPALPPKCHYTASVVSRDTNADIAVLQIDPTDIFGQRVDFSSFSTLPINMDYVPKSGDTVLARGYPWVGANTITETQGIVSGTAQYNTMRYIKTDTLIAGGNSGGPLIQDGQMVGVNTFLVGGGYDPSLGYSLLISEVADFLKAAFLKKDTLQSNNPDFPKFLQKIDTFSAQKKITDPIISINLPEKYMITSYIPSTDITASLTDTNATSVDVFGFYHTRTPRISTQEEFKNYLLRDVEKTARNEYSFTPVTIGGKTFYEVQYGQDADADKTKNTYRYATIVDETHLFFLYISTPAPTQNTLEKIQKSVKDFLGYITFPTVFTFPKVQNIVIPHATITLGMTQNTILSYDVQDYTGLIEDLILDKQNFVMARNFQGDMSLYAQVAVFKNSFETEDDSVDMWLEKSTKFLSPVPTIKKKVTYKGHEGFSVCSPGSSLDDAGKTHGTIQCESVFFIGANNDFIVSAQFVLPKSYTNKIDSIIPQYLTKILHIPEIGATNFHTQKVPKALPYTDVGNQSEAFRDVLGQLLSYGILAQRPMFEGDNPLTWKEYISLYIRFVYHRSMHETIDPKDPRSPTFEKALSVLPIDWNGYAEGYEYYLTRLHILIRLLVAGGSLPNYDFETVSDFDSDEYSRDMYQKEWDIIDAFEENYFPHSVSPKTAKYTSQFITTYNPLTGLVTKPKKEAAEMDRFLRNTSLDTAVAEDAVRCEQSAVVYFSRECIAVRKSALIEILSYTVLTKGQAIEIILPHMDLTLWDASLIPQSEATSTPTEESL